MIKRCHLLHGSHVAAAQVLQSRSDGPSHFILTVAVFLSIYIVSDKMQPAVCYFSISTRELFVCVVVILTST